MYKDRHIGVNRKVERLALKLVGGIFAFLITLYFAAFNYFN